MRILTVLGARPQFIKAAPVSMALTKAGHQEFLLHSGQHHDKQMSDIFFSELDLKPPDVHLGVHGGDHGAQTARMLIGIEEAMLAHKPDFALVYGDTNTTLAGALCAAKLGVPLVHVEAGLRSFNRSMPEEINRVLADHCANILFCPTAKAVELLEREGITDNVHLVGDTMFDAFLIYRATARNRPSVLARIGLSPGSYHLLTLHRPYTVDHPQILAPLLRHIARGNLPVVFPVHPRTRQKIEAYGLADELRGTSLRLLEPLGFLEMIQLVESARIVLTDSGGVQKEAFFAGVPCVTLRPETEWVETVQSGWNRVVGTDTLAIQQALDATNWPQDKPPGLYGDGNAAHRIVEILTASASKG